MTIRLRKRRHEAYCHNVSSSRENVIVQFSLPRSPMRDKNLVRGSQSINQSGNQSVNESINQINQFICSNFRE